MPPRRLLLATLLFACCPALAQIPDDLTEPGQLPPSTGFQNPDDISVLLDYRLPDWWSRTWTAIADLNGGASDFSGPDGSWQYDDNLLLHLDTSARWDVEGERTQAFVRARIAGSGEKDRGASQNVDNRGRTGDVSASISGGWSHYITDRWSTSLGGGGSWSYMEQIFEQDDSEMRQFTRSYAANAYAGIGYGRIRDVTPVIRAARLNERLRSLGHDPLAPVDVIRVAEGLSRQHAYSEVFARPDRRFWTEVLGPVTAQGGLTPFEMYYLVDVLQEDVGARAEGWRIGGLVMTRYEHSIWPTWDGEVWQISPVLNAGWSHNFSLDHQLSARGWLEYRLWETSGDAYANRREVVFADLSLEYLWAVADRVVWTTVLRGTRNYGEVEWDDGLSIGRQFTANISTSCAIHVEDRLALRPSVSCQYHEWDDENGFSIYRDISYALAFSYDLDNTLN